MKTAAAASVVAALIALASCTPIKKGEYASGSATIFCDDGFKNILDEEIAVFEYSYPNSSIVPFYVSEGEAIDTLMADACQAAITTHELTKEEIKYLKAKHKRIARQKCIAVDAVALIVNKINPVGALSTEQIGDILNGSICKWSQLAGNDTTAIRLVFDNAESSTVSYLKNRFMDADAKISDNPNAYAQKNNAQVFDIVKKDKDALGVISVSWLGSNLGVAKKIPMDRRMEDYSSETDTIAVNLTDEVNIVKVSNPTQENDFDPVAYKPYQAYIFSGEYPLARKVYFVSTAGTSNVMHSFYAFLTGFVGQKIITKTGILPYEMPARLVELK